MLTFQSTSILDIEMRSSPERILCRCLKGKQELEVCIYIILIQQHTSCFLAFTCVRVAQDYSLSFKKKSFYTCLYYFFHNHCDKELVQFSNQQKHTES